MTTLTDAQTSAARLIRAMREPEAGDDEAAWTARWVTLLQDADIEDAEAAIADIGIQRKELYSNIALARASDASPRAAQKLLAQARVRESQQHYIENWIHIQDRIAQREMRNEARDEAWLARETSAEGQARRLAIIRDEELRLAILIEKRKRDEIHLEATRVKAEAHIVAREKWIAFQQTQVESAENYRAYKLAIVAREREIARERVASVRATIPDGSDEMVMVQASRHILQTMWRLSKAAGIDIVLPEHEFELDQAIRSWLEADATERAVSEVALPEAR